MKRRTYLAAVGVGFATPLGGCLGGSSGTPGDVGTATETTTAEGETVDAEIPEQSELVAYETVPYAATGTRPGWFAESGETVGTLVVAHSEERADAVLSARGIDADRRDAIADFLANTDFGESVLLYVESVGPDACHDAIEVADLSVEGGELLGTASVVDSSEGDGTEGGGGTTACAQSITFPSALVRATFSGERAMRATLELTDGWGNEAEVTSTADDPLSSGTTTDR